MAVNLRSNLVYCYEADENTGTSLADANGGSFAGSLQSGATWGAAKLGASAVSLDGGGGYVFSPTGLGIDNVAKVTVALWFLKSVDGDDYDMLFSHRATNSNRHELHLGGAGQGAKTNLNCALVISGVAMNAYNAAGGGNITLSNGTWYHAAFVFDGTASGDANRVKLYVNGAQQTLTFSAAAPALTPNISGNETHWGRRAHSTSLPFAGRLDQLCLWTKALSAEEITFLYNSGFGRPFTAWEANAFPQRSMGMWDLSLSMDDAPSFFFNG